MEGPRSSPGDFAGQRRLIRTWNLEPCCSSSPGRTYFSATLQLILSLFSGSGRIVKFGAICDGDRRQCGIRHTPALPAAILEREHTSETCPDVRDTASPPPVTIAHSGVERTAPAPP